MNILHKFQEAKTFTFEYITEEINKLSQQYYVELNKLEEKRIKAQIAYMKTNRFKELMFNDYKNDMDTLYINIYFLNSIINGLSKGGINAGVFAIYGDSSSEYIFDETQNIFSEEIWEIINDKFQDIDSDYSIFELYEWLYVFSGPDSKIYYGDQDVEYLDDYLFQDIYKVKTEFIPIARAHYEFFERNKEELSILISRDAQD